MHKDYLLQSVKLAQENKIQGGRPFAAILVKDEKVLTTGVNEMVQTHDATSHAELEAIRKATKKLKTSDLKGCIIYASGHPCPMCIAAILATNIDGVFYAYDNVDAEPYGYSSEQTYQKLGIKKELISIDLEKLDVGIPVEDVYG